MQANWIIFTSKFISLLYRFYRACALKNTFLHRTKDRKKFMDSLNYPFPWFLMVQPFSVFLSAPVVFQLTRRTSQETQQVFDWLISILHLSEVLSTVVFSFSLPESRFWERTESFVRTCLSRVCWESNTFKGKKLRLP